jgi:hypothetical protein
MNFLHDISNKPNEYLKGLRHIEEFEKKLDKLVKDNKWISTRKTK